MKKKLFVLALATTLALTGCKGASVDDQKHVEETSIENKSDNKAIIGYWGGTCEAPIYVAYELGYFEEEGIDVELLQISKDVAILMQNNELDAFMLTPDKFKPMEQGLAVSIIDSLHTGCIQGAASLESGIKTVEDLEGKTIAARVGGIPQIQISSQMVKLGKDPSKVKWVDYPVQQMELALEMGEIDGFAAYDPFPEIAVENGYTKFYSNTFDEGLKEYLCCFLGMSTDRVDNNPELAKKLSKAFGRACEYLEEKPEEAAKLAIEKGYIAGSQELNAKLISDYTWIQGNQDLLNESFDEIWQQISRAGALDPTIEDVDGYIKELRSKMVNYMGD